MRRGLGILVAAAIVVALAAGGAAADPKRAFGPIDLVCGDRTYTIVAPGQAEYGVALDTRSNTTLVVMGFRNGYFEFWVNGELVDTAFEAGPSFKGSGKQKGQWCSYSLRFEATYVNEDDEEVHEVFVGRGEVKLHISSVKGPRR